ncbi:MAG: SDR family NAD(P)-dependent oxidoreductase, partial [Acidimicrobiia bacterium]|nr:SDR family NAD(P)-dependent oxidoreductase [Acidimicrobiia bacterium]
AGGEAIANTDDISTWTGGESVVQHAIDTFGRLDVLVNNAGILRDRMLFSMTEEEWDAVIRVHLKGTFVTSRHAAAHWRERAKAGQGNDGRIINTTSVAGLYANPGQTNYGAAKAGIAALTVIAAQELGRYGVRVNAIAPAARTRMTEATPGLGDIVKAPEDASRFDIWDPANVSPMVAYLATENLPFTGRVFFVQGGKVQNMTPWQMADAIDKDDRWTVAELENEVKKLLG